MRCCSPTTRPILAPSRRSRAGQQVQDPPNLRRLLVGCYWSDGLELKYFQDDKPKLQE